MITGILPAGSPRDARSLNQATDLALLLGGEIPLAPGKRPGLLVGTCWRCDGARRLAVDQERGRWKCHYCDTRWQSALDYVMLRRNLPFPQALRWLAGWLAERPTFQAQARPMWETAESAPDRHWQQRAWYLAQDCQRLLHSTGGAGACTYLGRRGLQKSTLRSCALGLCPHPDALRHFPAAARRAFDFHGFEEEIRARFDAVAQAHGMARREVRGILIPWPAGRQMWQVKLRLNVPGQADRYWSLPGSSNAGLFGANTMAARLDLVVTEGEFDAMLLWQEAGDLVDVVTVGSKSTPLAGRWLSALLPVRRAYLCVDNDPPGEEAAQMWLRAVGPRRGQRLLPPAGKDLTAAWQAGHDLRRWIATLTGRDPGSPRRVLQDSALAILRPPPEGKVNPYR